MEFRQQLTVYASPAYSQLGTSPGPMYGFGNAGKTNITLQASFFNASNVQTNPTSAEVWINPSNDGLSVGSAKICDFNTSSGNQNGDTIDSTLGPVMYVQPGWNIIWGSATYCVITIVANAMGDK